MVLFRRKKNENMEKWNVRTMFGPNMSFSVTEAYKLLRANIMFSFSDEGRGHVVGITSSLQSEGKSSTALNTVFGTPAIMNNPWKNTGTVSPNP